MDRLYYSYTQNTRDKAMTTTVSKKQQSLIQEIRFKILVLNKQIAACLREIYRGIRSYIDRLVILEDKLEGLNKELTEAATTTTKNQIKSIKGKDNSHVTATEIKGVKALLASGLSEGRIGRKNYFIVNKTETSISIDITENYKDDWGRPMTRKCGVVVLLK